MLYNIKRRTKRGACFPSMDNRSNQNIAILTLTNVRFCLLPRKLHLHCRHSNDTDLLWSIMNPTGGLESHVFHYKLLNHLTSFDVVFTTCVPPPMQPIRCHHLLSRNLFKPRVNFFQLFSMRTSTRGTIHRLIYVFCNLSLPSNKVLKP